MSDDSSPIDVLAEAVRVDPSTENQTKLWSATFALERWWFVQRGEPDNPQPFVGVHQDQPFLMAFTSGERARGFAVANGLVAAEDDAYVLALSPDSAVAQAPVWLQKGIAAITFDHGTSGYFAPLGNLPAIRAHVLGDAP